MDTRDLTSLRATEVFELSRANPEFIDRIIGTIPKDYETFEKILYVYFKMCAVLNYDSKFWASMQQGSITIPHLDYTRLEKYDETNNEIVCYEFTNLLKKALDKIGVFSMIYALGSYHGDHTNLMVKFPTSLFAGETIKKDKMQKDGVEVCLDGARGMTQLKILDNTDFDKKDKRAEIVNKLGVVPDSSTIQSIDDVILQINSDNNLTQSQKELKIEEVKNDYLTTCDKFLKVAQKVLNEQHIIENRFKLKKADLTDLEKAEKELKLLLGDSFKTWSSEDKIALFLYQVSKINMADLPAVRYGLKLFKNIQSDEKQNYQYTILRERQGVKSDIYDMVAIFSKEANGKFSYIKITPPNKIEPISQKELQRQFNDKTISYIGSFFEEKAKVLGVYTPQELINKFANELGSLDLSQKSNKELALKKFKELGLTDTEDNYNLSIVNFHEGQNGASVGDLDLPSKVGAVISSFVNGKWNYKLVSYPNTVTDFEQEYLQAKFYNQRIEYDMEGFSLLNILPGITSTTVSNMLTEKGYITDYEANFKLLLDSKYGYSEEEHKKIFEYLCAYSKSNLEYCFCENEKFCKIYNQDIISKLYCKYGKDSEICDSFINMLSNAIKARGITFNLTTKEKSDKKDILTKQSKNNLPFSKNVENKQGTKGVKAVDTKQFINVCEKGLE